MTERTSVERRAKKTAGAVGFLGMFAFLHGSQAMMGIEDMAADYADLNNGISAIDTVEMTVSSAYTAANAAVAYTQLQIGTRVTTSYFSFKDRINNGGNLAQKNYSAHVDPVTPLELAATLAGQLLFLSLMDN